jgi:predicted adenine nucleotide alpha hydrolase (AANH) superfamily ATPase
MPRKPYWNSRKGNGGNKENGKRIKSCQATRVPEALHYATEIAWKQHTKLSRLRKPGNGKQTPGACKETGEGDGRKGNC